MLNNKTIAFLGAGSMAEAMIAGIAKNGKVPKEQIIVSNRSNKDRLNQLEFKYGILGITKENLNFDDIDILFLAMKPKDVEVALQSIRDLLQPHHVILSVLAGISTSFIEQCVPTGQQIIRVMPNTSSMIGESATAISSGVNTTKESMRDAEELLKSIGEVYVIPEDKMDIFTGIAGSGPAYFYYLVEHMEQIGMDNGLPEKTTRKIIAQTILGAAKMLQQQDESPAQLRKNITSPNGTTAAGLEALDNNGGGNAIKEAVINAANRSKEISSELEKIIL